MSQTTTFTSIANALAAAPAGRDSWDVQWGTANGPAGAVIDLGLCDKVTPKVEIKSVPITVGTIGKDQPLGYRVTAVTVMVTVELRQLTKGTFKALTPWNSGLTTTAIAVSPMIGTDLYQYSDKLLMHPVAAGTDTSMDLVFLNTTPVLVPNIERDGSKDDVLPVVLMAMPPRTALAANPLNISPGTIGQ